MNFKFSQIRQIPASKLCFYALVFLLPFGTRKVFFTHLSFFYGYHILYHTAYVYLTDIIFCCLIIAWIHEISKKLVLHRLSTEIANSLTFKLLGVFWLISALSVMVSREIFLSGYGLLKISEYLLVFAYIVINIDISREIKRVFWLILASSWVQTAIAILQYFKQRSFGLKLLGEEFLRPGLKGLAEFVSHGISSLDHVSDIPAGQIRETINMRAYGTFPHPNVLAGFLFLSFIINLYLLYFFNVSREIPKSSKVKLWRVSREILLSFSLIFISIGLTVTFSRMVWLTLVLALLGLFIVLRFHRNKLFDQIRSGNRDVSRETYKPGRTALIVGTLLVSLAFNYLVFGQQIKDRLEAKGEKKIEGQEESLALRNRYNSLAWHMIKANAVFGVGVRNFVARMDDYNTEDRLLPYMHQPVHNIYLLLATETGILGFGVFLIFLFNIVRHAITARTPPEALASGHAEKQVILSAIFFGFLFIGLFDHYLWTIQQGTLTFWIIAGLLSVAKRV